MASFNVSILFETPPIFNLKPALTAAIFSVYPANELNHVFADVVLI